MPRRKSTLPHLRSRLQIAADAFALCLELNGEAHADTAKLLEHLKETAIHQFEHHHPPPSEGGEALPRTTGPFNYEVYLAKLDRWKARDEYLLASGDLTIFDPDPRVNATVAKTPEEAEARRAKNRAARAARE